MAVHAVDSGLTESESPGEQPRDLDLEVQMINSVWGPLIKRLDRFS